MNFDESVKTILQGEDEASPVTQAKKAARPVRDDAVKGLKEFDSAASAVTHIIEDAQHVRDQALMIRDVEIQVYGQRLNRELDNGLLRGGGQAVFLGIITRIDQVTPMDIAQDPYWLTRLEGAVKLGQSNIGALREVAAKIERMTQDLKKLIAEKARTDYTAPNEITP